jgi:hypothetical protein
LSVAKDQDSGAGVKLEAEVESLRLRAEEAGLETQVLEDWGEEPAVQISFPDGRGFRTQTYVRRTAQRLGELDLASIRFLPDLLAAARTDSGEVEARVGGRPSFAAQRIPGIEYLGEGDDDDGEDPPASLGPPSRIVRSRKWRIAVERDDLRIEISSASEWFRGLFGYSALRPVTTLKIVGMTSRSTNNTSEQMQKLSDSLFFDLDVRYGFSMELSRVSHVPLRMSPTLHGSPPEFPRNKYQAQPLALYRYGRAALGLPLLSFLAYYQVLEFFFPIFTHEEITRRVRQTLANPRFDPTDEVSLLRLISAVKPGARASVSEREQLRSTIRRCLDSDQLESLVTSSNVRAHFCERPQSIQKLDVLRPDSGTDIRDQVADRIYDIRCRIVHTKSDGGDSAVDLLLPSSPEARSLSPDVELVRLAAQEAIIVSATPLDVT